MKDETLLEVTRPIMAVAITAVLVACMAFVLGYKNHEKSVAMCSTLQKQSVLLIQAAQLSDFAQTRADKSPSPAHIWQGFGALDREMAIQNALLCGLPPPPKALATPKLSSSPLPKPSAKAK